MKKKLEFHLNHLLKLSIGCITLFVICAILSQWMDILAHISMVFAGMALGFGLSSVFVHDGLKDTLEDAEKDRVEEDDNADEEEESFFEQG